MDFNGAMEQGNQAKKDMVNYISQRVNSKIQEILLLKMSILFQREGFKDRVTQHIIEYCKGNAIDLNPEWIGEKTKQIFIHDVELEQLKTLLPNVTSEKQNQTGAGSRKHRNKRKSRKTQKRNNKKVRKKRYVGGFMGGEDQITRIRMDDSQIRELTGSMRNFYNWILNQPAEMMNTIQSQIVFTKDKLLQDTDFMKQLIETFQRSIQTVFYNQLQNDLSEILQKQIFLNSQFQGNIREYLDNLLVNEDMKIDRFKTILQSNDEESSRQDGEKTLRDIFNNYNSTNQ